MPTHIDEALKKIQKPEILREIAGHIKDLFERFEQEGEWFHWEIFGWAIAQKLGLSDEDIEQAPEIGWLLKALIGVELSASDDKKMKAVGETLLNFVEIPPEEILVKYGKEGFVPAIISHYRQSWRDDEIKNEYYRIARH